jgi:hypothetical protein
MPDISKIKIITIEEDDSEEELENEDNQEA